MSNLSSRNFDYGFAQHRSMKLATHINGKLYALRTLLRMVVWLTNWRAVWSAYRISRPIPPLHFRRGLILLSGPSDDPVVLLREVFADGCYRRYATTFSSGVMVDIGANIGAASLDLASCFPKLVVHAYEPNPSTARVLSENVKENGFSNRIHVYGDAVGRETGEFILRVNGSSVTATGYGQYPPTAHPTSLITPMIKLDEVMRRAGGHPIEFLKIDAEGAEGDILEGASPSTLSSIRRVVLEYHEWLVPGVLERCKRVLSHAGFRLQVHPANSRQGMIYGLRTK